MGEEEEFTVKYINLTLKTKDSEDENFKVGIVVENLTYPVVSVFNSIYKSDGSEGENYFGEI